MSRPRAGVDVGGTFTDLVAVEAGRIIVGKVLSTPADPSRGVLAGLAGLGVTKAEAIVHGSTVATNAVLERKGARTALITTAGFRDVLEIGRQNRPDLYATEPVLPVPLVGRELRHEATERVDHHGQALTPLDEDALRETIAAFSAAGVESCAVCFLFSFLNPDHERRTRDLLREAGFEYVSLSADIIPEFREFERTSTVCLNAYVEPIMSAYLHRLADEAPGPLWIVQSNGGVLRADEAAAEPVRTVLSGPASGVVGALETAGRSGFDGIVTFDMGGTSTDVALCPGRPLLTNQGSVGGFPVAIGMIDIHTVGAGGGSLAYL
ncbi:MAG TPA: hydantoinase/oxoprolinase family protein, partial [Chloroflexota bacterium]|nr:hydantoinase/oxoprolinase family protein [Chloroflexota bacterium]